MASKRRKRRLRAQSDEKSSEVAASVSAKSSKKAVSQPKTLPKHATSSSSKSASTPSGFYYTSYKKLLIIPLIILVLALLQIGVQIGTTGDFVNKGISLSGGVTVAITHSIDTPLNELQGVLENDFPGKDIIVRELSFQGSRSGVVYSADVQTPEEREAFESAVRSLYGVPLDSSLVSIESTGPSLGASFYSQALLALLFAFIFMALMVLITFRALVPSLLVVLAAFSNLVMTLAIFNIFGFKLSTAGLAAFLMLLGYSVDTDILLTSRVLRHKEGSVYNRVIGAWRTGTAMTVTTFIAVTVAFFFATSEVIHEIMSIVLIGLVVDYLNTWIQNAGLLRWSLEKKKGGLS